ncbi:unnamed protein product [Taenia asiatica]|uniref:Mitochondrial ribosomal protein S24 n=1 Tax=Taenia asiatica TaxID=60517 RepID=A0A0R3W2A8_TAEAS|nr:unnamed protein product [Taenia asiatica]
MYGHATVQDWLHTRRFLIGRLPNVSAPLRQFFKACLTHHYNKRLSIDGVKRIEFYRDVSWKEVVACKLEPPYHPSEMEVSPAKKMCNINPFDPLLVAAAYGANMPLIDGRLRKIRDKCGVRRLMVVPPNHKDLAQAKLTAEHIDELFANFDFVNPHSLCSCCGYRGRQANFGLSCWSLTCDAWSKWCLLLLFLVCMHELLIWLQCTPFVD